MRWNTIIFFVVLVANTDAVDNVVFNDLCAKIIILLLLLMRQKCVGLLLSGLIKFIWKFLCYNFNDLCPIPYSPIIIIVAEL